MADTELTEDQLWAMVSCSDLSENVHAALTGFVATRGRIDEDVIRAVHAEVERANATIRLRRLLLSTALFDPIREQAQAQIDIELEELAAILPELLDAHRRSQEQQALVAAHLAEAHRVRMEGAIAQHSLQQEIARDQADAFDEQMRKSRDAAKKRHDLYMEALRGSRY